MKKLSIALLGTRGIPARYGGFETFAEQLACRLVERGHQVTVYCRKAFFGANPHAQSYRGVKLKTTSTIMHKYAETPLHSLTSFLSLLFFRPDVVLLCNAANSPFAFIARLLRIPLVINVDGIERKRSKWNQFGKLWYRLGEYCSVVFGNRIVSDAHIIAEYYRDTYKCPSTVIRYGAVPTHVEADKVLAEFNLKPQEYLLYVSRLEPENNALGVIEAYAGLDTDMPLVVVGDAPYADEYKRKLYAAANDNVIFTGFQFEEAYFELRAHCYAYIQATEVGGTHPALVEAMAFGNCIIANGVPEHLEVLAEAGEYYWKNDFMHLRSKLEFVISQPSYARELGQRAKKRAERHYQWDVICDKYEELLQDVCR